jgi:hypothetical protein
VGVNASRSVVRVRGFSRLRCSLSWFASPTAPSEHDFSKSSYSIAVNQGNSTLRNVVASGCLSVGATIPDRSCRGWAPRQQRGELLSSVLRRRGEDWVARCPPDIPQSRMRQTKLDLPRLRTIARVSD